MAVWRAGWGCCLALVGALLLIAGPARAQATGVVTGTVTDATSGRPIAGAQVFVSGTTRAAVTDQQGRYRLPNVPVGRVEVRASYPGYGQGTRAVTVGAGATVTVDFALQPSAVELDVLVVNPITGQLERRRELGTNTTTITAAEFASGAVVRLSDALAGRAAGVLLQIGSGSTGTAQRIRLRGVTSLTYGNDPLIFVDGIQVANGKGGLNVGGQGFSRFEDHNPEDIEAIEIIRGPAAAALYGTAGANGVLRIRTRRGVSGPPRWRAWSEIGWLHDATDWPDLYLSYERVGDPNAPLFRELGAAPWVAFNTTDYRRCRNVDAAEGRCAPQATLRRDPLRDPTTRPFTVGRRTVTGASVAGGSPTVRYYVSGERDDERGPLAWNRLGRSRYRLSLDAQVTPTVAFDATVAHVKSSVDLPGNDNSVFGPIANGLLGRPVAFPELDRRAAPGERPSYGYGFAAEDLRRWFATQTVYRYLLGATVQWQPRPWLSASVTAGFDFYSRHDNQTIPPRLFNVSADYWAGWRTSRRWNDHIYSVQTGVTAVRSLGTGWTSTTTLGTDWKRNFFEYSTCYGRGLVPGTASCATTTGGFAVDENRNESRTFGWLLRQQLAWRERRFLDLGWRFDRTSGAGAAAGWQGYPAVGASWVVSDEPWFPAGSAISLLRLRAGYGEAGLRVGTRDPLTLLNGAPVEIATTNELGLVLAQVGNPALRPERTAEIEAGADLALWADRLSLDVTAYRKTTRDAVVARPLPPSFGLTGPGTRLENLARIDNRGTEIGLRLRVGSERTAQLEARLSAATLRNRLRDLGPGVAPIAFNRGTQWHLPGFPAGAFFRTPYIYEDANGDGRLSRTEVRLDPTRVLRVPSGVPGQTTELNLVYVGPVWPTRTQALSLEARLARRLTVTTLLERRAGMKTVNFTEWFRCTTLDARPAAQGYGGCRATDDPTAPLEEQARFLAATVLGLGPQAYIEDADFVKWRELAFRLDLAALLGHRGPRSVALTVAGRNLATWTRYSGVDPEISESGATAEFTQGELNTEPPPRTWLLRVDLAW